MVSDQLPVTSNKPTCTLTISGPQGAGKTTVFRIMRVFMEKSADYHIRWIQEEGREVFIAEDDFHRVQIEVSNEYDNLFTKLSEEWLAECRLGDHMTSFAQWVALKAIEEKKRKEASSGQ